MAQGSLAKSSSKLNLSRRQTALFQRIILTGNQMAAVLRHFEPTASSNNTPKLVQRWSHLMVQLAEALN